MRPHNIELYMTYFLLENRFFQFTLRVFITRMVQSEWNGIFIFRVCSQNSLYRGCNHMKCNFMQFCFIKRNQTRFKSSRKLTSWRKLAYSLIVARENFRSARAVHTSILNCIFAFVREQQEWYTKTNTWNNKNKAGKNTARVSKQIKSSFFFRDSF